MRGERTKKRPRSRDEQKQASRAALVDAALELFLKEGIDGPSLDAICERAGYTRGAFYVHFATRDDILVAAMEKVGADYLASVFRDLGGVAEADAGKRFRLTVARFLASVERGDYPLMPGGGRAPRVKPHQLLDACARSPVVRERYASLVDAAIATVAQLVEADQREGGLRKDVDARAVSSLALALIIGAQTMTELGIGLDATRLAKTVEKMLKS
jgi:AcrR family transcriptional regulator